MTRKIKILLGILFILGLLCIIAPNKANADEVITQIVSDPASNSDTSTAISNITIQSIESKIDSATSTLYAESQEQSNAIISSIQANVPNTDTQTAISIATTQEPIKTAVESVTVQVQEANIAIQDAQTALSIANSAKITVDTQTTIVDSATALVLDSQNIVNSTLSQVDSQTVVVSNNQSSVQDAQANLQSATITTITNGITASVYYGTGRSPALPSSTTTPIFTTTVPQIAFNWGSGSVLGGPSDRVIIKFEGTITVPDEAVAVKYAVSSDDGSMMYIDGQLAINNWRDQGTAWSPYSPIYNTTTDKQQDFTIWYYENGGGATCTLGWLIWRADGTGYFTTPGPSAFGTTKTVIDPAAIKALEDAQAMLVTNTDILNQLQQDLITANQNLANANQNLTNEQQNLTIANQNLTIALQTANALADTATVQVQEAADAMKNAAQVTVNYYAEQAAIKAAADALAAQQAAEAARLAALQAQAEAQAAAEAAAKALAEQQAAEAAKALAEQQAAEAKAAADKAAADALAAQQAAEAKAAQDKADAEAKAAQDAANAKAEADKAAAEQAAKDKAAKDAQAAADAAKAEQAAKDKALKDAQAKVDAAKAAADKAEQDAKDKAIADAIGVKPNNPDQLPTDKPKLPDPSILVPKVQVDKAGVENGGIEFFGTKAAPQVVGEDGKLTPPAPPPGSGLPIPAEAITTQDTFIGQPGGTTFNAPDIAVPVLMTYVCQTITKDGIEIHVDVNGVEHPVAQCTFLPAALNAIPGAGQAVQAVGAAYTAMANIGNDMSPVTRKKAKKILVLTVAVAAIRRRFGS